MAVRFRDRFFTPPVARAITSPSAIVAAGAGAAVGLLVGGPLVAVLGGGLAYGARVAVAVPRRKKASKVDPFVLEEPWRGFVRGAIEARARYERAVSATRAGPLRDHLGVVGDRLDRAVEESWRIASHGDDIDRALATIDTGEARRELTRLTEAGPIGGGATADATRAALEAQLATASRLARVSADARDRLRLLDARLDELVARAVELSVGASDAELGGLGADVDGLVTEMEALRLAIEETSER